MDTPTSHTFKALNEIRRQADGITTWADAADMQLQLLVGVIKGAIEHLQDGDPDSALAELLSVVDPVEADVDDIPF